VFIHRRFLIDPDSGGNRTVSAGSSSARSRAHLPAAFGYYDKDYAGWQPNSRPGKSQSMRPDLPKYKTSDEVDFVIVAPAPRRHHGQGTLHTASASSCWNKAPTSPSRLRPDEVKVLGDDLLTTSQSCSHIFRKTPNEKAKPQRASSTDASSAAPACISLRISGASTKSISRAQQVGPVPALIFATGPSLRDLEPYYTKVEWEIGVSGQAGAVFRSPRSKPYPCRRFR